MILLLLSVCRFYKVIHLFFWTAVGVDFHH